MTYNEVFFNLTNIKHSNNVDFKHIVEIDMLLAEKIIRTIPSKEWDDFSTGRMKGMWNININFKGEELKVVLYN